MGIIQKRPNSAIYYSSAGHFCVVWPKHRPFGNSATKCYYLSFSNTVRIVRNGKFHCHFKNLTATFIQERFLEGQSSDWVPFTYFLCKLKVFLNNFLKERHFVLNANRFSVPSYSSNIAVNSDTNCQHF